MVGELQFSLSSNHLKPHSIRLLTCIAFIRNLNMLSSFSTDYGKSNMEKEKKKGIGNGIYLILLVLTYTHIHKCFYEMVVLLKFELGFEP